MKTTISSIELACLVKEFQSLIDGKVNKIWLLPEKELLMQLHLPNKGKIFMRIKSPDFCYLTNYKQETPEKPHGFCMFLRKYLDNARIREIKQLDFERILEIIFEKKEGKFHLHAELFAPGNFILTDGKGMILSALETQKWKDREIIKGNQYVYPKLKYNLMGLKIDELKELITSTDKENIVKALAIDLGLGGVYAEELLLRAKIDKNKNKLSEEEIKKLFDEIKIMRKIDIEPYIIESNEIIPFNLLYYHDKKKEKTESFNTALDKILTECSLTLKHEEEKKTSKEKISKEERIIQAQEGHIIKLKKQAEENQQKGEAMYHHYQLIDEILKELNNARKKYSWKEIREKLKCHKIIKEINEKENEVVVEIL